MASHYQTLGVPSSASDADIRRAYKQQALRWHPDKNPRDRVQAELMFKRVAEAYKTLSDPGKRLLYDRSLQSPPPATATQRPTPTSSFFSPAGTRTAGTTASGLGQSNRSTVTGGRMPEPSDGNGMDEAWTLFEQVFGGRDPFKDFDAFFEEPTAANAEALFAQFRRRPDGASSSSTSTSTAQGQNQSQSQNQYQSHNHSHSRSQGRERDADAPLVAGPSARQANTDTHKNTNTNTDASRSRHWVRCTSQRGVAWRRSPNLADRMSEPQGPECGDVIAVQRLNQDDKDGGWVRARDGWLPLCIDGAPVFELFQSSQEWRVRCLSAQGVAFRCTRDLQDRVEGQRGPEQGELLAVEELRGGGSWVRTLQGFWLPLAIDGSRVLEFVDAEAATPTPTNTYSWLTGLTGQSTSGFWWWPLPSSSSGLPLKLLTVLGASGYVALRAARLALSLWWRMSFAFLPFLGRWVWGTA